MRKSILPAAMAVILCVFTFISCQKAPDAVAGNGILHAQGDLERQVQEIVGADVQGQTPSEAGAQGAGRYQGTVGTGTDIININAEIPGMPDDLYVITLQPDDGLDRDALLAFLDSGSGSIEDTSRELLEEIEESDRYNSTAQDGERFLYSKFGDHSALRMEGGTKEASFAYRTSAYYVDHALREKCQGIFGGNYSETLITPDRMGEGSFSAERAAEILLDKLGTLGVSEIAFEKIYYVEGSGYSYYEMYFIPVLEGLAVDIGSDSYGLGQVRPDGFANVSQEGVAEVNLMNFCGRAADQEPVTVISFEQVLKILEQYLDSGMIESDGRITYDRVELIYYPVPTVPARDEIEYKSELALKPIWHIYMPLDEYIDGDYGDAVGPTHICVDAVTGELVEND